VSAALAQQGYRQARALTRAHARSFSLASALLCGARKRAAYSLYAICRQLDDLVDGSNEADRALRLGRARAAISALYGGGRLEGAGLPWSEAQWAAFGDTVQRFGVPQAPLQDLVTGMEMDLVTARYASWDELDVYCYRAAGTVGLLMASILGATDGRALGAAADLGRAMQLTNILRDVREDLARGRVYLPQDELRAHGLTDQDLAVGRVDDRFRAFMRAQIGRARALYAKGEDGIRALGSVGARSTVRVMSAVYGGILGAIEEAGYDVFSHRVHVPLTGKLALAARALLGSARPPRASSRAAAEAPQARAGQAPGARARAHPGDREVSALPSRRRRAAVIGGGIGGLVAAGALARAGLKVTLYEAGHALGGKAGALTHSGLTLDTGPTLLTMPDVVRRTFSMLGAGDLLPRFIELTAQCHYAWQDGATFSVHRELEATAAAAEALTAGGAAAMRAFYRCAEAVYLAVGAPFLEAPYLGPVSLALRVLRGGPGAAVRAMRLGTLDALARRVFASERLVQFAGRFATYAGASPFEASAAFAMIPHLERAQGVFHPVGGLGALASALALAVRRLGVEVRLGQRAHFRRRDGVLLAGPGGDEAPVDAVVVNADPLAMLGRASEPLALSGFVLLLCADRRLDLPHHTVLFSRDPRAEFAELFAGAMPADGTVYVCHPAASDPSMAPAGRSGLFVMLNAPALSGHRAGWASQARQLEAWCLARLRGAFPSLRGVRLEVLATRTPETLAAGLAPGGSIYGFLPHGAFGPLRRPLMRAPVPNVYFAGGGTHPGGGVPLVMRSGAFAARLACEDLRVAVEAER
jgi:1-hydroxycarotenoid 3,4-desaturase